MNEKIISGKECSKIVRENLKEKISKLDKSLKLVVIRVGNDEASKIYVNSKGKACTEVGIDFLEITFRDDVSEEVLIDKINSPKTKGVFALILPFKVSYTEMQIYLTATSIFTHLQHVKLFCGTLFTTYLLAS